MTGIFGINSGKIQSRMSQKRCNYNIWPVRNAATHAERAVTIRGSLKYANITAVRVPTAAVAIFPVE